MYRIIDKELRIWSCSIADLTMQQVNSFLRRWEIGAKIGELTLFYDSDDSRIVLNEDNPEFEIYKKLACTYIRLDEEKRERLKNEFVSHGLLEAVKVLDGAINRIKADIIINQAIKNFYDHSNNLVLERIIKSFDCVVAIEVAFNYGVMVGKRIERARRKKGDKIVANCD